MAAPIEAEQDCAAAPALQHEWEASTGSGVVGSELSDLFHEPVDMQVCTTFGSRCRFVVCRFSQACGSSPELVS